MGDGSGNGGGGGGGSGGSGLGLHGVSSMCVSLPELAAGVFVGGSAASTSAAPVRLGSVHGAPLRVCVGKRRMHAIGLMASPGQPHGTYCDL